MLGHEDGDAQHGKDRWQLRSEAALAQTVDPDIVRQIYLHETEPPRYLDADFVESLALPGLSHGVINLKNAQPDGGVGITVGIGIQAGAQDHVLAHATLYRLGQAILSVAVADRNECTNRSITPNATRIAAH